MKSVTDFLKKIGLLKTNSGDYITGEFDNQKDTKKNKTPVKNSTSLSNLPKRTGLTIFWILSIIIALFLLLIIISYGFSLWFFVMLITWGWFIKFMKIKATEIPFPMIKIIFIFIALIIVSLVVLIPSDNSESTNSTGSSSSSSNELASERIKVNQASFSGFMFATDPTGKNIKNNTVHLSINPMLSFNVNNLSSNKETSLKSFEIKNINFTKKPSVGKIKIIHPKHRSTDESCTGFYFGGCKEKIMPKDVTDDGKNISYEVINNSEIKQAYYDQIDGASFISPKFKIVFHNIGTFDYADIMEKNGSVNSSNYAKYLGLQASDLASTLEFDVIAEFEDGERFKKQFTVNFTGDDLMNNGSTSAEYK